MTVISEQFKSELNQFNDQLKVYISVTSWCASGMFIALSIDALFADAHLQVCAGYKTD